MREAYLHSVRSLLDCPEEEKARLMNRLNGAVSAYLEDHPDSTQEHLLQAFGSPEDCAAGLLEECTPTVVVARKKKRQHMRLWLVILGVLLALALALVGYLWSNGGLVIIEHTHYVDGIPEGFPMGNSGDITVTYHDNKYGGFLLKKCSAFILTMILCFNFFDVPVAAADTQSTRIDYEDGSYAIITTERAGLTRAVTADTKTYTYYNPLGQRCFAYTLYATFTYDGVTSTANTSTASADIYLSGWGLSSHNEFVVGTGAYGNATFYGPSGEQRGANLSLICDKNGNVT